MPHPYWARREIARLDPERDARRIVHLSFEVRYGQPLFVYTLFALAFSRQVAVPDIARVLWRGGRGDIVAQTRKRNQDTLLFFGQFFRHWDDEQGQQAAAQLVKMHARFPIHNDLNLYTLATLACEPQRVAERFGGRNIFTANETRAMYVFWRRIGEMLGIHSIPADEHALRRWMDDYEARSYAPTADGQGVVKALAADIASLLMPRWLQGLGEQIFYSTFDDALLHTHQLKKPGLLARTLTRIGAWIYLRGVAQFMPDAAERDLISAFGGDYGRAFDLKKVGPKRDLPTQ
jgi:hypothetical protein